MTTINGETANQTLSGKQPIKWHTSQSEMNDNNTRTMQDTAHTSAALAINACIWNELLINLNHKDSELHYNTLLCCIIYSSLMTSLSKSVSEGLRQADNC